MISIDELQKMAAEQDIVPTYFGLGIIRLKFSLDGQGWSKRPYAYHFYSSETAPIPFSPVHDHFFTFTSTVLKGALQSQIYGYDVVDEKTDYALCSRKYSDKDTEIILQPNINPYKQCVFETKENEQYTLDYRSLHHVEPMTDVVVTLLEKEEFSQFSFNYIQDKRIEYTDPHISPKSPEECWDIINRILAF